MTVPADSTVLAAVRAELPGISYSCEQGFCGTCQQRVLEGEMDHRDELLTDAERDDSMLICVSRRREVWCWTSGRSFGAGSIGNLFA